MDLHFLDRPNARRVQLDFFYDYRTNVALDPQWQEFLREQQPKTIIFWGQDDVFFTREGGEANLKDLPNAANAPVEFRSRRGRGLLDHDRREDNGLLQEDSNGVVLYPRQVGSSYEGSMKDADVGDAEIYNHNIMNTLVTFEEQPVTPEEILARIKSGQQSIRG